MAGEEKGKKGKENKEKGKEERIEWQGRRR